jgi:Helicase conserved C-terminal domain
MSSSIISPRASITEDYWLAYIDHHSVWSRFSPEQRREIFAMPVIIHAPIRGYGEPSTADIEYRADVQKLLKAIDCNPKFLRFHVLIRLMQICHAGGEIFAPDRDPSELGQHLVRHVLSPEAAREFNAKKNSGYSYQGPFVGVELELSRFNSRSRLRSFLAIPEGEGSVRWEADQRQYSSSFQPLSQFSGKVVGSLAREILNRLIAAPGPLALMDLLGEIEYKKNQASYVAKALRGLSQYVFTIAACNSNGDGLMLGLWPGLKKLLSESSATPLPPPPAAQAPTTTFAAPFFCTDIATVVVHATAKPILLKQASALELYAAEERKLAAQLEELPRWMGEGFFETRRRATVASFAAKGFGWLTLASRESQLTANPSGRDWLSLSPSGRLQKLLDQLRGARWGAAHRSGLTFSHVTGHVRLTASDQDILACEDGIAAAFHDAPVNEWADTNAWLDHAAHTRNPIVATVGEEASVVIPKSNDWRGIVWVKRDAEVLESEAREMLANFLFRRLIPLGGAEIGLGHGKNTVFRLNEIGRYYIGATREFPTSAGPANGRVIVQPNFEIMILGSNLLAEADLTGFCERTGAKSGAVFRITRQTVQQALDKGATTGSILATLRALSDCDLPANVATEIGGWAESRKTFVTRAATLLVCPDATVAARIRGLLPKTVVLNDTTLELTTPLTTPQRRKLEAAGIFKG